MSPEIPATEAPPAEERSSRAATSALVVALVAITLFGVLAVASHMGWLPRVGGKAAGFDPDKAGAITRPGPPRSGVPLSSALLPGETLVAEPDPPPSARPDEPLMPHYAEPAVPKPAPPRPAEPAPAATAPAPKVRPAPARTASAPGDREPGVARAAHPEGVGPSAPSYGDPPRRGRGKIVCDRCGIVTEVSPSIDQWDVHVRFEDGTRRVLRYPTPPNVGRGDRVVFSDGRLDLR